MGWHLVERVIDSVSAYATLTGRLWTTVLFLLRIVIITSIGEHVYGDEQSAFDCNTKETGCPNACYSAFAPISQIRFWGAQVICVATPSAFFVVYSIERKHKDESKRPDCSETSAIPKRRPSHAFINMTSAQHSTHESLKSRGCREHRLLKAYFWQGFQN